MILIYLLNRLLKKSLLFFSTEVDEEALSSFFVSSIFDANLRGTKSNLDEWPIRPPGGGGAWNHSHYLMYLWLVLTWIISPRPPPTFLGGLERKTCNLRSAIVSLHTILLSLLITNPITQHHSIWQPYPHLHPSPYQRMQHPQIDNLSSHNLKGRVP